MQEQTVSRDEWVQAMVRLSTIAHDVGDIKVELRELRRETNERFDRMTSQFDERLDRMATHFDERFDRMSAQLDLRLDAMHKQLASQTR
jgi:DNA anti-recombination protein RmuC